MILLYLIHVIVSLFLILVVLLQQGKGADLSVFGGGSTQAAFGARSATTLLHKLSVVAFVAFILTTLSIGLLQGRGDLRSVTSGFDEAASAEATEPVTDDAGAPPAEATESDATATSADGQNSDGGAADTLAAEGEDTDPAG